MNGRIRNAVMALGVLLACRPCAVALNPSLDISQYAHTAWRASEGFSKGTIWSIAQTPDGYLWLGTEFGLLRFDGVRVVPWQPPAGERLPNNDIRSLRVGRDGRLWIGTYRGLASWKDSKLVHYPELDAEIIEALVEDREGTMWVAGGWTPSEGKLCGIPKDALRCQFESALAAAGVTSLYEDGRGILWVGTMQGVWQWKPGPPRLYPLAIADSSHRIYAFSESDDGGILIATRDRILKLRNGRFETFPSPGGMQFPIGRLFRDRDGGLWAGSLSDVGLWHFHNGKSQVFTPADGLSCDAIASFFEDREGNIWVGSRDGLDRFHDFAVPTISMRQGLSSQGISSVLAANDGSIWLGASDGLDRWDKGEVTVYRNRSWAQAPVGFPAGGQTAGAETRPSPRVIFDDGLPPGEAESLFQDGRGQVWVTTTGGVSVFKSGHLVPLAAGPRGEALSFAGDPAGNVWMSHQEGLYHFAQERLVERIPWAKLGRGEPAGALIHDAAHDALWIGFRDGGVALFKQGQLRKSYTRADGLAGGMVNSLYLDRSNALWVAAAEGLSRIAGDRAIALTSRNGLPCDTVLWMMDDNAGSVWLYTACGMARIARSDLDSWIADPRRSIRATVFDNSDGVLGHPIISGHGPIVAKAPDGKIWFVSTEGVSVLDPQHVALNITPPPVHIERITADDQKYDPRSPFRLSPPVRNFTIDFIALSLVAPQKNRYRYKLEGWDRDWREAADELRVEYTNLPPRHYRFRVIACNNSGVWNEAGDSLDFDVPPAWYQTLWFFALCAAAFLLLVWAIYRMRLHQIHEQEKKFREAVETMPALAFVNDRDGNRAFVNRAYLEFTGLSPEQALGSGWHEAIHPDDLKRVVERWRTAQDSGELPAYDVRVRRSDGTYRWFQTRARPLLDKHGKIAKWCAVAADIEDRKRAEELQAELAHVSRVSTMGELAASISHELNQPIAASIVNADLALHWLEHDPPDLPQARQRTRRIIEMCTLASEIIDRLRSLYKKEAPKRESLSVNEVIGEMVELLRGQATRYAVSLRANLGPTVPNVIADRVQVQQVLMNLMLNGIEAMSDTGGVLTVISELHDDAQIEVTVDDTGPGLPAGNADQIFDAFFTTKPQGSGMGLAISKSIIESHGGRIWSNAQPGRGAAFHFTLPLAPSEADVPASMK